MKKTYLILCILGIILPYYNLINFLKDNDWSMSGFFDLLFSNYAVSMISMDLSVAASSFLIFILYKFWKKPKKLLRYIIPLFLVGFSLSLPLYLYDNEKLKYNEKIYFIFYSFNNCFKNFRSKKNI